MRTLTDTSNFDDPITVIADGEPLDSAHIGGNGAGQASQGLSNRTRWLKNQFGAASGVATLDSNSRVVQYGKNAIIVTKDAQSISTFTTSSGSYVDVTGATFTITTALGQQVAGDLLDVSWYATLERNLAGGGDDVYLKAQYSLNTGVTWSDVPASETNSTWTNQSNVATLDPGIYTFPRIRFALGAPPDNAQLLKVKFQARNVGATNPVKVTIYSFSATLVRP